MMDERCSSSKAVAAEQERPYHAAQKGITEAVAEVQ